jgi:hypothetical protein
MKLAFSKNRASGHAAGADSHDETRDANARMSFAKLVAVTPGVGLR